MESHEVSMESSWSPMKSSWNLDGTFIGTFMGTLVEPPPELSWHGNAHATFMGTFMEPS